MSSLSRWTPVRDLITMREMMDQVMGDVLGRQREYRQVWTLPMDAFANEDAIVLMADVPGLRPEDVEVTLEGDTLTIRGEFKARAEGQNYLMRERMTGRFERTLTINTPIDASKIEATFENGVVRITLPKAEAVKPRQITVKAVK